VRHRTFGGTFGEELHDMALVKWDSDGNVEWNRTWGGSGADYGAAVWCDGSGTIYTCGFTDSPSIGTSDDSFLIKWDDEGNVLWARNIVGDNIEVYGNIWGDGAGNIYVAGHVTNNHDFSDAALMKWDTAGTMLWALTWDSPYMDYYSGMWGDGAGGIYTSGTLGQDGVNAVFLNKWDAQGSLLWYRTWKTERSIVGDGIWGDGAGNIFVTGNQQDPIANRSDLAIFSISVAAIEQVEVGLVSAKVVIIVAVAIVSIWLFISTRAKLPKKVVESSSSPVWRRHSGQEELPYSGPEGN
jgi:hypothetical protein